MTPSGNGKLAAGPLPLPEKPACTNRMPESEELSATVYEFAQFAPIRLRGATGTSRPLAFPLATVNCGISNVVIEEK